MNYGVGQRAAVGGMTGTGGVAKRKLPSKAIRIVDPNTMEEVDVSGSGGPTGGNQAPRSMSPAPITRQPIEIKSASDAQHKTHSLVHAGSSKAPPNALISTPPTAPHQTYTPKAPRLFSEESGPPPSHAPNPNAPTFRPNLPPAPPGAATGQIQSHVNPPEMFPSNSGGGLLATPNNLYSPPGPHVAANGHAMLPLTTPPVGLLPTTTTKLDQSGPLLLAPGDIPKAVVPPAMTAQQSMAPLAVPQQQLEPVKPVSEPSQLATKTLIIASEKTEFSSLQHKKPLLPTPGDQGSLGQIPSNVSPVIQTHVLAPPTMMSSLPSVLPETGESAKSDDMSTPPTSLVETKETVSETVSDEIDSKETHSDLAETTPLETEATPPEVTESTQRPDERMSESLTVDQGEEVDTADVTIRPENVDKIEAYVHIKEEEEEEEEGEEEGEGEGEEEKGEEEEGEEEREEEKGEEEEREEVKVEEEKEEKGEEETGEEEEENLEQSSTTAVGAVGQDNRVVGVADGNGLGGVDEGDNVVGVVGGVAGGDNVVGVVGGVAGGDRVEIQDEQDTGTGETKGEEEEEEEEGITEEVSEDVTENTVSCAKEEEEEEEEGITEEVSEDVTENTVSCAKEEGEEEEEEGEGEEEEEDVVGGEEEEADVVGGEEEEADVVGGEDKGRVAEEKEDDEEVEEGEIIEEETGEENVAEVR